MDTATIDTGQSDTAKSDTDTIDTGQPDTGADSPIPQQDVPLPEPTFLSLLTGLATQTMVSLGVFPNPMTGETQILLHQGKHLIDTIAMLSEKTAGNRTPEETATLESLLHELRVIYVEAKTEKEKRDGE